MTNEQIKEMALEIALRFHLSEMGENEDGKATDIFEALGIDEEIVVWEPFEDWDMSSVEDSIWNLANDIEQTVKAGLGQ